MTLLEKLFKLQQQIKPIVKDQDNSYFKGHKYFDINKLIETVKPFLAENKLVISQPIKVVDGNTVLCTIISDVESTNQISSEIPLPSNIEPQKMGSAITYYRRYSLQSLLFLEAEDDDGNSASGHNEPRYEEVSNPKRKVMPSVIQGEKINPKDIPF
jgi:hypothetical protein